MSKMLSFKPRVGNVKTGQTPGGFAVIIPKSFVHALERLVSVIGWEMKIILLFSLFLLLFMSFIVFFDTI